MRSRTAAFLTLSFAAALAGCTRAEGSTPQPVSDDPLPPNAVTLRSRVAPGALAVVPPAVDPQPAAPADSPAKIDETGYTLAASGPATTKVGQTTKLELTLTPKAGYHVNMEAPFHVTLAPPAGVKVAKNDLDKPDAAKMAKDGAAYAIAATATSAGSITIPATVKFVVCDDAGTTCMPSKKSVAWTIQAK